MSIYGYTVVVSKEDESGDEAWRAIVIGDGVSVPVVAYAATEKACILKAFDGVVFKDEYGSEVPG